MKFFVPNPGIRQVLTCVYRPSSTGHNVYFCEALVLGTINSGLILTYKAHPALKAVYINKLIAFQLGRYSI